MMIWYPDYHDEFFFNMMRSLIVIFFILNTSAFCLPTSPAPNETVDRLNPASFVCRTDPNSFVSAQDLPDAITSVDVKDHGNSNDPDTGMGMVIQEYGIAQTEITARQYCYYLNQVATGENYDLFYHEKMGSDPNVASIKREVIDGKNVYTVIKDGYRDRGNFPIVYVNLYQAARFCNWLQNQNKPDLKGDDLTERGAYTLNLQKSGPIARNPGAVWFIPTENEWYKPAYYKGGGLDAGYWKFANRSDYAPVNSLQEKQNAANYCYAIKAPPYLTEVNQFSQSVGAYNTFDMSGNVAEWVATEENQGAIPLRYVARGGSWKSSFYGTTLWNGCDVADWGIELSKWSRPAYDPTQGYDNVGFRVATSLLVGSVPPSTVAPGEYELSPTHTVEAVAAIAAGVAVAFSAKNIIYCREEAKQKEADRTEENNRLKTNNDLNEVNSHKVARNGSEIAAIAEGNSTEISTAKQQEDEEQKNRDAAEAAVASSEDNSTADGNQAMKEANDQESNGEANSSNQPSTSLKPAEQIAEKQSGLFNTGTAKETRNSENSPFAVDKIVGKGIEARLQSLRKSMEKKGAAEAAAASSEDNSTADGNQAMKEANDQESNGEANSSNQPSTSLKPAEQIAEKQSGLFNTGTAKETRNSENPSLGKDEKSRRISSNFFKRYCQCWRKRREQNNPDFDFELTHK